MFDETESAEQINEAPRADLIGAHATANCTGDPVLRPGSRQSAAVHEPSPSKKLVLTAHWDGSLEELRSLVDSASDWGPFELLHATPAPDEKNTVRAVRCSFLYHGRAPDRARFESNLFELLRRFAFWTGDKPAQHTA